jgi:hypothetical protein
VALLSDDADRADDGVTAGETEFFREGDDELLRQKDALGDKDAAAEHEVEGVPVDGALSDTEYEDDCVRAADSVASGVCEFAAVPDDDPVPSVLTLTTDVPDSSEERVGVETDETDTADDVDACADALVELDIDAVIADEGVVDADNDARLEPESRPLLLVETVLDGDASELTDARAEADVCAEALTHSDARDEGVFELERVLVVHEL